MFLNAALSNGHLSLSLSLRRSFQARRPNCCRSPRPTLGIDMAAGKKTTSSPSQKTSSPSSDRRQWQRIFQSLVDIVKSQQSQIESLAHDQTFLQRYIQIQHDCWSSRDAFLESCVAQLKREGAKERRLRQAKLDLMLGMKQAEASSYKRRFEHAESDLEDFQAYIELLVAEVAELKKKLEGSGADKGKTGVGDDPNPAENSKEKDKSTVSLERELRRLKHSYKKLASEKETEVSALLKEKDFVWNQFKRMESDYTCLLKAKRIEVDKANEAIEKIQKNLEDSQSSNNEKVQMIAKLEAERTGLILDAQKANETIKKLQLEMEMLHSEAKQKDGVILELRNYLVEPNSITTESQNKRARSSGSFDPQKKAKYCRSAPSAIQKKARVGEHTRRHTRSSQNQTHSPAEDSSVKASKGLKPCSSRKGRSIAELDGPKLFNSNFKVPKLKG